MNIVLVDVETRRAKYFLLDELHPRPKRVMTMTSSFPERQVVLKRSRRLVVAKETVDVAVVVVMLGDEEAFR